MIKVNDFVLNTSVEDIIRTLRTSLHEEKIDLLRDVKDTIGNIMVTCPVHKNGKERKPSCGISKETGVCHCFTCGYSANLTEFISNCFNKNDGGLYGDFWLRKNFLSFEMDERPEIKIDRRRRELPKKQYTYVPDMVLEQYRFTHPYFYQRKLNDDIIEKFDLGFDKETNCVTFPVLDEKGNCLFIARRSVDTKYFHYPSGAEKPLYGIYQVNKYFKDTQTVYVCESMFNALTLWVHGYPAIALNGTGSDEQLIALSKLPMRQLVLCLDPDEAGKKGARRIKNFCKNKLIYTVDYTDERDINDLEPLEVELLISTRHLM